MGRQSIKLVRVFGIRIGVDVSWFVVFGLFIFLLSDYFKDVLGGSEGEAYAVAVASALLFFFSLILHELGHALMARKLGIGISGIDLFFFGGMAKMTRDTNTPGEEFKVAAAGPAVTLVICAVCSAIAAAIVGPDKFVDTVILDKGVNVSPGLLLLIWIATMNAFLLAFNLVPAFPLDGGRIFRSIVWKITGNRNKATRFAAFAGQLFAYVLFALGIVEMLFQSNFIGGIWWLMLGFFLYQAARGTLRQTTFSEQIEDISLADVMDSEPVVIPSELPVAQAVEEFFLRYRWPWFGIIDTDGRLAGLIDEKQADAATVTDPTLKVEDVMIPAEAEWQVPVETSIEQLLSSSRLRTFGSIFVTSSDGRLRGVVTINDLQRAISSAIPQRS